MGRPACFLLFLLIMPLFRCLFSCLYPVLGMNVCSLEEGHCVTFVDGSYYFAANLQNIIICILYRIILPSL